MSQLVPCPSCSRHVRLSNPQCPFCDVALDAAALSERYASRRAPVPAGIKRAALVALGTVAAACGGQTSDTSHTAPVLTTSTATTDGSEPNVAVPIYGASVSPESSGTSSDVSTSPVSDVDETTTEPLAIPAYGIGPIYPETTTSDGPVSTTGAEADAGAAEAGDDAGADAAAASDTTDVDEWTNLAQPAYGAPIRER